MGAYATVTITITPVNDNLPVADTESFTVLEGGTATEVDLDLGTSLLDGDTDIDLPNDTLTVNTTPVVNASFGLLMLNANGTFSYTHDGSENFADSFTYEVSDALGNADTAIVTITITPVNDPPTAITPTAFNVNENTDTSSGYSLGLLNTTDEDSPETFAYNIQGGADQANFSIGGVSSDELILTDGTLDFETKTNYTVIVRVTDSGLNTFDETITVNVNDINDAPKVSLSGAIASMAENTDTTSSIKMADIVIDDDALGTNTLAIGGSDAGKFEIVGGSELHLKAGTTLDFETQSLLNVTVAVDDTGVGGAPDDMSSLAVTLSDVNEAPIAVDDTYVAQANSAYVAATGILANDTDPEGAAMSFVMITPPSNGTLTLNLDGSFTYIPDNGFFGTDVFVYQIDDGVTSASQATVSLFVDLPAFNLPDPTTTGPEITSDDPVEDESTDENPDSEIVEDIGVVIDKSEPIRRSPSDSTNNNNEDVDFVANIDRGPPGSQVPTFLPIFAGSDGFTRSISTVTDLQTVEASFTHYVGNAFINVLDGLRDEVNNDDLINRAVIGSTMAVSALLSVGYVIWLIRGGVLLSSALSSLPAWRMVDPLPILGYLDDDEEEIDDDSLETLVTKSNSSRLGTV